MMHLTVKGKKQAVQKQALCHKDLFFEADFTSAMNKVRNKHQKSSGN